MGFASLHGNLLKDAQELQPVLFVAMPHIWNQIYADYQSALKADTSASEEEDTHVLAKFSKVLGGRLQQVSTGGAGIDPKVYEFMQRCFRCPVTNAYGTTEVIAALSFI